MKTCSICRLLNDASTTCVLLDRNSHRFGILIHTDVHELRSLKDALRTLYGLIPLRRSCISMYMYLRVLVIEINFCSILNYPACRPIAYMQGSLKYNKDLFIKKNFVIF